MPDFLAQKESLEDVSLYFHLPFCTHKCAYCHFFVLPDKAPLKHDLMEGLELEWKRVLPLLKQKKIRTIYFGGGTPWLMGADRIAIILSWIKQTTLDLNHSIEITLEANPENVTLDEMRAFADAGINRISIGIQSLDPGLLKILDRQHSAKKAEEAVYAAFNSGITNISVDLMYDLPNQTLETWKTTLKQAVKLPITHLSLYNLTIEPHTVFYKHRERLLKQIPDSNISLAMYETAIEELSLAGLNQYEISAFAKKGYHSQHNTGYWLGRPFLGLGPSAFSDWEGSRFQNVANLNKYLKALKDGHHPVDFREQLDPEARRRELLAIQIRLLEGVCLRFFQNKHGILDPNTLQAIEHLCHEGFIAKDGGRIRLTEKGVLFYDTIATELV